MMEVDLIRPGSSDIEDGELVEDNFEVDEQEKKILRAKRFGLSVCEVATKSNDPETIALQKRMGIEKDTRAEAIHLHGTENLKTDDIFEYFQLYPPASIEWLSDNNCNVVWLDEDICAKALLNCSYHIRGQNGVDMGVDEEDSVGIEDVRCALPPGGIWRKGKPCILAPTLLMRYAKLTDRRNNMKPHYSGHWNQNSVSFPDEGDEVARKVRVDSSNPWMDIALQWSDFEYKTKAQKQEFEARPKIRDARELLQRRETARPRDARELISTREAELLPGRKMVADTEEKKIQMEKLRLGHGVDLRDRISRKRLRAAQQPLRAPPKDDVTVKIESLQRKLKEELDSVSSSSSSSSSDSSSSSSSSSTSSSSDSETDDSQDLRQKLRKSAASSHKKTVKKSTKTNSVHRSKAKKFVPSPLRIEIDNDIYYKNGMNE